MFVESVSCLLPREKMAEVNHVFIFYFSVYRGPQPFSEPETSAVRDFIDKQKQIQEFAVKNPNY